NVGARRQDNIAPEYSPDRAEQCSTIDRIWRRLNVPVGQTGIVLFGLRAMVTDGLVERIYFDTELLGRALALAVIIEPRHLRQVGNAFRVRLLLGGLGVLGLVIFIIAAFHHTTLFIINSSFRSLPSSGIAMRTRRSALFHLRPQNRIASALA